MQQAAAARCRKGQRSNNRISRTFSRWVDWSVETYRWTLEWVLERQRLTLLTTAATLVATVLLYIVVPKGFLPLQDTSLITAVVEGGPEISFTEMQRLQKQVEDVIRKDGDVAGVVSVVGSSPINATPNVGHAKIALRSRDHRSSTMDAVVQRLEHAVGEHSRRDRLFPAGAGRADLHPHKPRAISIHPHRHQPGRGFRLGGAPGASAANRSGAARRGDANRRRAACG